MKNKLTLIPLLILMLFINTNGLSFDLSEQKLDPHKISDDYLNNDVCIKFTGITSSDSSIGYHGLIKLVQCYDSNPICDCIFLKDLIKPADKLKIFEISTDSICFSFYKNKYTIPKKNIEYLYVKPSVDQVNKWASDFRKRSRIVFILYFTFCATVLSLGAMVIKNN